MKYAHVSVFKNIFKVGFNVSSAKKKVSNEKQLNIFFF